MEQKWRGFLGGGFWGALWGSPAEIYLGFSFEENLNKNRTVWMRLWAQGLGSRSSPDNMLTPYRKRVCSDCRSGTPGKQQYMRFEQLTLDEQDATFMTL